MDTLYNLTAKASGGAEISFSDFAGKALVVVNTASKCGFTPQYAGLEALYKKYKDAGLVILGFPCDQFAHQEPGGDAEIASFCSLTYGVTFPLMAKIQVNGPDAHPVFKYLRKRAHGFFGDSIKWNFTKFLVSRDGKKITRFAPDFAPEKMEDAIRAVLGL